MNAKRQSPQTASEFLAKTGIDFESIVGVNFSSTKGWIHNEGGPVWTASLGNWKGYGIANSKYDIGWKFLRMIGAV